MTRGRKPDAPGLQAAKGNPGKRKSKRENAERRAAELAATPSRDGAALSPPAFLKNPGLTEAAKIWAELAPELVKNNLLSKLDRHTFARWCVYQADWIAATKSITKDGIWMMIPNVNGEQMPRRNPACAHRDRCESNMQQIEAAFGLTPAHRYKVLRDQASLPVGGLFGLNRNESREADEAKPTPAAPPSDDLDPIGLMSRQATLPPGTRPN